MAWLMDSGEPSLMPLVYVILMTLIVKHVDLAFLCSFFKLFPKVNQHSEGLMKFGRYVAAQISNEADVRIKKKVAGVYPPPSLSMPFYVDLSFSFHPLPSPYLR